MKKVTSSYRIIGGFGLLLGLCAFILYLTFQVFTDADLAFDKLDWENETPELILAFSVILGLNVLVLALLATQARFIIADEEGITFINPVLPFLRKRHVWTDLDYFIMVDEKAKVSTYEAVWLIKDGKVKGRFSSFYYTNYEDIKEMIKTESRGLQAIGTLEQITALLGLSKMDL